VEIIWAVKDSSISAHFVDAGAAEFFLKSKKLQEEKLSSTTDTDSSNFDNPSYTKRLKYTLHSGTSCISFEYFSCDCKSSFHYIRNRHHHQRRIRTHHHLGEASWDQIGLRILGYRDSLSEMLSPSPIIPSKPY
jgi:hypothetical protein